MADPLPNRLRCLSKSKRGHTRGASLCRSRLGDKYPELVQPTRSKLNGLHPHGLLPLGLVHQDASEHRLSVFAITLQHRHAAEYVAGCRELSRQLTHGWDRLAVRIHELVQGEGYVLRVPTLMSDPEAPSGPQASAQAAHLTGESWGPGATAVRQNFYRHAPRAEDYQLAYEQMLMALARPS